MSYCFIIPNYLFWFSVLNIKMSFVVVIMKTRLKGKMLLVHLYLFSFFYENYALEKREMPKPNQIKRFDA